MYERDSYSAELPPADVCPATAYLDRWRHAVMTGWVEWDIPMEPTFATIRELIDSWDANWPLTISDFTNAAAIAEAIKTGDVQLCADGSYMANLCTKLVTTAWLIKKIKLAGGMQWHHTGLGPNSRRECIQSRTTWNTHGTHGN